MDPFSAVAGALGIIDVALRTTSALISFLQDTKNASTERRLLVEEACSLSGLLERLQDRTRSASPDEKWLEDRKDILEQFQRAYDDLARSLKLDVSTKRLISESRFRAIRTATKWSFTKSDIQSLLERVNRLQQYANTLLLDEQHVILEQLKRKQEEGSNKKQKSALLAWLSPLQMSQVHQTISDRTEDGSGEWFLTSDKFVNWENGYHRLLWCEGMPGAGKTVIASIVVNHLRRQQTKGSNHEKIGVAVIYLKYNDPEQTLNNVLASLLKQLVEEQEAVPDFLQAIYERHCDYKTSPSLDGITETLKTIIALYTKVFLITDGLDECSEEVRWGLTERLREFQDSVHIMITSRFLESIQEELEDFEQMEIKAHESDIGLFIDRQIRKNRNLRKIVQKNPEMRNDIKKGVVKTAENMFLLAQLHVDALANAAALSIRNVRNKLQDLPTTLERTYDEAMQRIRNQESDRRDVALKTLAWVSYAFRSLSLKELQHAVAIIPGDTDLDEDLIMDGSSITALCAGLVIVDPRINVVNLVHYTTRDYFEKIRSVSFPNFHATITMSCATYLTFGMLRDADIWKILRDYPLAGYAAQYMADHARQNPEEALESSILETLYQLLSHPDKRKPLLALLDSLDIIRSGFHSSSQAVSSLHHDAALDPAAGVQLESLLESITEMSENMSQNLTEIDEDDGRSLETQVEASRIPEVTALHLAASMGLAKVAAMLMKETPNIDAVDETGTTALAVAMERGFEKAVEFLVNSGACVDLRHPHGRQMFLLVTERGWDTVAANIADKAKMSALEDTSSVTRDRVLLILASYRGDEKDTRLVVDQANIDLKGEDYSAGTCALFVAVERGHLEVVDFLLTAGVNVNSKDSTGQTSLHRATRLKSEALMRLLLKKGAALESKDDNGRTAFSANAKSCDELHLRILLNAGADPNTTGHDGISELYEAAANGQLEYVKILLKSGTNPSIKTRYGWTPLHWAANNGHAGVVKLLLQKGAEPSPLSDQNSTPLDMALRANQSVVADLLTRVGAKESRNVLSGCNSSTPIEALEELKKNGESVDTYCIPNLVPIEDSNSPDKLSLTLDKPLGERLDFGQFVYPSNFPGTRQYYYHISHPLDTHTNSLSIRRTTRRADMTDYPIAAEKFFQTNVLYEIVRFALDYQELELRASTQKAVYGQIKMVRGWNGNWKACHENEDALDLLFRVTLDWSRGQGEGNRWITDEGKLLARSGMASQAPTLTFEHGLEKHMQDLLVACWVAKLWSENSTLRKLEG